MKMSRSLLRLFLLLFRALVSSVFDVAGHTSRADISANIASTVNSGNGVAVNSEGVKGQFLFAAMELTKADRTVAEGVQKPLLPDPSVFGRPTYVGVTRIVRH